MYQSKGPCIPFVVVVAVVAVAPHNWHFLTVEFLVALPTSDKHSCSEGRDIAHTFPVFLKH